MTTASTRTSVQTGLREKDITVNTLLVGLVSLDIVNEAMLSVDTEGQRPSVGHRIPVPRDEIDRTKEECLLIM